MFYFFIPCVLSPHPAFQFFILKFLILKHQAALLRRIMNIKWFDRITNEDLWIIAQQEALENQIKRRKWNWTGHTLRKETGSAEKTALDWNPQGYRRSGRPKRTWRRKIEEEI
jgi:hypothetical protein